MPKIEILAPVGSEEMLRAAVFSGADAVYLGFSGFNARTGAGNFDADSLKEAVRFCHARGVKVHVALNTTVYGGELAALAGAVKAVAESGADAVICQDLAVAQLIGRIAPDLPRHGSTQMSVHTLQGALELKELGFTRVVLARELSLPEVEHITKHCGIETECFVHGALCMCVSGQCYMSAFLGGRSGNRGSCAGPCRLPFEANPLPEGKPGRLHHLSLKDNSVIDKLDRMQAVGVASAKIEGRLRTPEDVGQNKARCVARRVQPFLEEGCTANGVDTDLCRIGPEALADYDVVVLCLDNYAAKALFNELWMQLPPERRPVVIMDGTQDEMARSVMLDGREFCLRCLMDERWLENGAVRTSCSGPQLRAVDGETVPVRTSGLASSHAANLTAEQFRAQVIGVKEAMNRRLTYYAYPNMELTVTHPKAKRGCPGCAVQPPKEILWLEGTVLETTLGQALEQIAARLGQAAFELQVHWLNYKQRTYTGFIRSDLCHVCGAPIKVMRHEVQYIPTEVKMLRLIGENTDIPMPRLIAFDDSCSIVHTPYFFL